MYLCFYNANFLFHSIDVKVKKNIISLLLRLMLRSNKNLKSMYICFQLIEPDDFQCFELNIVKR